MDKKKLVTLLRSAAVLYVAVLVLVFPEAAAASAVNSINVCINSIIPSMFIFMVITSYIRSSGLYRSIFRPVLPILRKIIKADDCILSIFILSMTGGYPVGVKLLRELALQDKECRGTNGACKYASMFCYCISPSFAVIMLGQGVFKSTAAGVVIYISDILSCIITGAAVSRACRLRAADDKPGGKVSIFDSINSSSRALFTVCTVIIAFNAVISCTSQLLVSAGIALPTEVTGILEISTLLGLESPGASLIPFVAAIASMGGICVLLQCSAIVKGAYPVRCLILSRIPCAILSALISWVLLRFVDISVTVSSFSPVYTYEFSANMVIVPVLIAMCIIILRISDKILKNV